MRLVILLALVLASALPLAATAQGAEQDQLPKQHRRSTGRPAGQRRQSDSALFLDSTGRPKRGASRRTPSRSSSPSETRSTQTTTASSV